MKCKRLYCIAAAALMLLSACGSDSKGTLSYEKRLQAAGLAANYRDDKSYLSCWLPQEKQRYLASDGYREDFLDEPFAQSDGIGRMNFKLIDSAELEEAELRKLEEEAKDTYGTRLDFTKARRTNVEIRLNSSRSVLTDAREITLVIYEGNWYIYGSVIDSFSFAHS